LNQERAYDYLTFGLLDHTRETMFSGVFQIRGGEAVEFSVKDVPLQLPVYQWYSLELKKFQGTAGEAASKFRELLSDSVRLRLRSDVPIGSCLSGGLDSSSIVCLVNDILKESDDQSIQKTFSAFSREKRVDESKYVQEVVACRKIDSFSVYPEMDDLFKGLEAIIWHQDEPFESSSIFAQWNVFKMASEHNVKVMLDGQGADELLGGYHYFFGIHFAGLLSKLKFLTLLREMKAAKDIHNYKIRKDLSRILYYSVPGGLRGIFDGILPQQGKAEEWFNLSSLSRSPGPSPFAEVRCRDPFTDQCYSRIVATNLPALLHWEDRNSMAFSIESRVPFLDYRLVEFSMSLPAGLKLSGGVTKKVLRDSMTGIIPEKIAERRDKLGFATPEEEWIRKHPDIWRGAMMQSIADSSGLVKDAALEHLDEVIRGVRPFTPHIWRAICLGKWMKLFNVACE
jgi:asparagine synthase (glutamine-hydrolysing)